MEDDTVWSSLLEFLYTISNQPIANSKPKKRIQNQRRKKKDKKLIWNNVRRIMTRMQWPQKIKILTSKFQFMRQLCSVFSSLLIPLEATPDALFPWKFHSPERRSEGMIIEVNRMKNEQPKRQVRTLLRISEQKHRNLLAQNQQKTQLSDEGMVSEIITWKFQTAATTRMTWYAISQYFWPIRSMTEFVNKISEMQQRSQRTVGVFFNFFGNSSRHSLWRHCCAS